MKQQKKSNPFRRFINFFFDLESDNEEKNKLEIAAKEQELEKDEINLIRFKDAVNRCFMNINKTDYLEVKHAYESFIRIAGNNIKKESPEKGGKHMIELEYATYGTIQLTIVAITGKIYKFNIH